MRRLRIALPPSCIPSPQGSSFGAGKVLDSRVRSSLTCRGIPTCCTPPPPTVGSCHQHPLHMGCACNSHVWSLRGSLYWGRARFLPSPCPPTATGSLANSYQPHRSRVPFQPGVAGAWGSQQGQIRVPWHRSGKSLAGVSHPPMSLPLQRAWALLTFKAPDSPGPPCTGTRAAQFDLQSCLASLEFLLFFFLLTSDRTLAFPRKLCMSGRWIWRGKAPGPCQARLGYQLWGPWVLECPVARELVAS